MTEEEQDLLEARQRLTTAAARLKRAAGGKLDYDEWQAAYGHRRPPKERDLLHISMLLTSSPHLIEGRWSWYIYHALKALVAKTPERLPNSEEVAEMVDDLVAAGMSLAEAREQAEKAFKKSAEAVKQAHIRHRRKKRDRSR